MMQEMRNQEHACRAVRSSFSNGPPPVFLLRLHGLPRSNRNHPFRDTLRPAYHRPSVRPASRGAAVPDLGPRLVAGGMEARGAANVADAGGAGSGGSVGGAGPSP